MMVGAEFQDADELFQFAETHRVNVATKKIGPDVDARIFDYEKFRDFFQDKEKLLDFLNLPNVYGFEYHDVFEIYDIDANLISNKYKKRLRGVDVVDFLDRINDGMELELADFIIDQINTYKINIDKISYNLKNGEDISYFLEKLSPERFSSLPLEIKNHPQLKKFVHNKIVEISMTLRGQFPSYVLVDIIKDAVDTSAFTDNEVLKIVIPINEKRKLSLKEKNVV